MKERYKYICRVIITTSLCLVMSLTSIGKNGDDIIKYLSTGDSKSLSEMLNRSVEITINGKEGIFSKVQGGRIIKDFFDKNRPVKFIEQHNGKKKTSQYTIGYIETQNRDKFRVYFLVKKSGKQTLIYQLKFEKQR